MSLTLACSFTSLLGILFFTMLPQQPLAAQSAQPSPVRQSDAGWENDRIRVRAVSVQAGARLAAPQDSVGRVLVFLTADLDGRMPQAEAVWQPAGAPEQENRGRVRVDAIVVDVKAAPGGAEGGTPAEAVLAHDAADVRVLIDNPRVAVLRMRYRPYPLTLDLPHVHPRDALILYLAGGYTWRPFGGWGYPARVRRGEFDVIPAHTLHSFGNAGGDNLEFLVILPK